MSVIVSVESDNKLVIDGLRTNDQRCLLTTMADDELIESHLAGRTNQTVRITFEFAPVTDDQAILPGV